MVYQRTVGGERPLCASVAAPRGVVDDVLAGWCSAKRKRPRLVIQYLGGMGVKPRTFTYQFYLRITVKLRRKADRRRWPEFGRPKTAPCSDRAPFPHF